MLLSRVPASWHYSSDVGRDFQYNTRLANVDDGPGARLKYFPRPAARADTLCPLLNFLLLSPPRNKREHDVESMIAVTALEQFLVLPTTFPLLNARYSKLAHGAHAVAERGPPNRSYLLYLNIIGLPMIGRPILTW